MKHACAVIALLAATLTCAAAQARTTPLQPFTSINVCTPFNLVIGPVSDSTYQLIVDADASVAEAINATVVNDVLTLSINGNAPNSLTFQAANAIKVAVQLPADQLASVAVSSIPSITVAIAAGFAVPQFTASLSGTSTLSAVNLKATRAELINAGTGSLYVNGAIASATVASSGTGNTFITGVTQEVAVDASGISKIFIGGAAGTQITGQIGGISNVYYDQGVCSIQSEFGGFGGFGAPCSQQAISVPAYLTNPQWSCALTLYGQFGCSNSGSSSSSSQTFGDGSFGDGTTSSSSSSTGGGQGTTFTSSTNNGVTTTTQGSSGPNGQSSLVTQTGTLQIGTCPVKGASLNMLPAQ